jgi:hypothetical protein
MILSHSAALYNRRMAIDEQIRDSKGARFGLKLVWTQIKTPQALARFTLLTGWAILFLTAIGHAVSLRRPDVRLTSKTKGHRLSLLTVGHLFFHSFFTYQKISIAFLIHNIPPPALRSFAWLDATAKKKNQK